MLAYFVNLIEAFLELNSLGLYQTVETIQELSIDFCRYFPIAYKYCHLRMDSGRSLYYTFTEQNSQIIPNDRKNQFASNNYSVTPVLQISTLNPENVSSPFAISGG